MKYLLLIIPLFLLIGGGCSDKETTQEPIKDPNETLTFLCSSGLTVTGTRKYIHDTDPFYLCGKAEPVCTHLKDITPTEKGTLALDEFTDQTCVNKGGKWKAL